MLGLSEETSSHYAQVPGLPLSLTQQSLRLLSNTIEGDLDSQYQQVIQLRRQHFDHTMTSQLSSTIGGRHLENS